MRFDSLKSARAGGEGSMDSKLSIDSYINVYTWTISIYPSIRESSGAFSCHFIIYTAD